MKGVTIEQVHTLLASVAADVREMKATLTAPDRGLTRLERTCDLISDQFAGMRRDLRRYKAEVLAQQDRLRQRRSQ